MNWFRQRISNTTVMLAALAMVVSICALLVNPANAQGKGFRWPLYDNAGNLKYQILGKSAVTGSDGEMIVTDMTIEIFGADKQVETRIYADQCTYDEADGVVVAKGDVKMEREGLVITGNGLIWNEKNGVVQILDQAEVTITDRTLLKERN